MVLSFAVPALLPAAALFVAGVVVGRKQGAVSAKQLRAYWVGPHEAYAAYSAEQALKESLYDDPNSGYGLGDVSEIHCSQMWDKGTAEDSLGVMLSKMKRPGLLAGTF